MYLNKTYIRKIYCGYAGLLSLIGGGLLLWSASVSAASPGTPYTWPVYNPTIDYNFRDEFPAIAMPTKDLDDCQGVAGTLSNGWWTFKWGSKKNSLVTETAIRPMLERLNEDFAYFRDTMGWPPDKRVQNGYRSAVYLFGSGLCTDNASNTEKGGWQSSVGGYPIILASYYPVYCFDPACNYSDRATQMGGMVHEGIHCILASLPGCKKAAWFHEGGNTWLQQQAEAQRTGNYSEMGFLNGTTFLAPFMPIECYSGWLQDGSFGGPSAEGVDMNEGGQQICTWRRYLGGNQYGNAFPTFLGEWLGLGSVPWIWRNCPERVLEGISAALGDEQTRRLIMEYRAKQALIDMKKWSNAFKKLLNDNFGSNIGAEFEPYWINCAAWKATPYAKTVNANSTLTPEERTLPGWSGANQIPLTVSGDRVTVDFQPIGANMSCQLCYRANDGTPVYSTPVTGGECSLRLDKTPGKGVVIAVICNTDYKYLGEETRKAHFDYRLKLVSGVTAAADIYTKWYDVDLVTPAVSPPQTGWENTEYTTGAVCRVHGSNSLMVEYNLPAPGMVACEVYTPAGKLVYRQPAALRGSGQHTETIDMHGTVSAAMYLVRITTGNRSSFSGAAVTH
ncbi:MAG: hypothetical protein JW863_12490 [Chitinispirillaceae bacterium]|nr:hypothetical protein [Chitinispirillaceae bacterium]